MQDRIQVNGIWYIREDSVQEPQESLQIDATSLTDTLQCTYEIRNWCFEAMIMLQTEAESIHDTRYNPWIIVTDKRPDRDAWIRHEVDNVDWMLGVLDGNAESMQEAHDMFDLMGLAHFRAFLLVLISKGWLKR